METYQNFIYAKAFSSVEPSKLKARVLVTGNENILSIPTYNSKTVTVATFRSQLTICHYRSYLCEYTSFSEAPRYSYHKCLPVFRKMSFSMVKAGMGEQISTEHLVSIRFYISAGDTDT